VALISIDLFSKEAEAMAALAPDDLVAVRGFRVIAVAPEGDKVLVRYEIPARTGDDDNRAWITTHF
jgi:hypothetical protein